MSNYREFLSPLQNMALDIMMNTEEGSTEALISAREILSEGSVNKVSSDKEKVRTNYVIFYADFESEIASINQFLHEEDMLEYFPSKEIQDAVLEDGLYIGKFETYHLLEIKV